LMSRMIFMMKIYHLTFPAHRVTVYSLPTLKLLIQSMPLPRITAMRWLRSAQSRTKTEN
jgi:hypothetical protein